MGMRVPRTARLAQSQSRGSLTAPRSAQSGAGSAVVRAPHTSGAPLCGGLPCSARPRSPCASPGATPWHGEGVMGTGSGSSSTSTSTNSSAAAGPRCDELHDARLAFSPGPRPATGSDSRLARLGVTPSVAPPLFLAGAWQQAWYAHQPTRSCTPKRGDARRKRGLTCRPQHNDVRSGKYRH